MSTDAEREVAAGTEPALRKRVAALHRALCAGLIERVVAARLLLLALLAGEHVLFVGPPGTAKSELARRLGRCLAQGGYFERLLTKFSVPEELFGPLSIKSLEVDSYLRLTDGYMPAASLVFLDEVFNANSAILNALLTLLNEREFDNGARRVPTPLLSVVAATNDVPDAPELAALHDRFLFRCVVRPVGQEHFRALLDAPGAVPELEPGARLTVAELAQMRAGAAGVVLPESVCALLDALRRALQEKDIYVSDRRWRRVAAALRVAAFCDGRGEVRLTDCGFLPHCLWSRPEQIEVVDSLFARVLDACWSTSPSATPR